MEETNISTKSKLAYLQNARNIMATLVVTEGMKVQKVATPWHQAGQSIAETGIWIDGTDTRNNKPFPYQKMAANIIKEIDALSTALKSHDVKNINKHSEKLSEQIFEGVRFTVGYEQKTHGKSH